MRKNKTEVLKPADRKILHSKSSTTSSLKDVKSRVPTIRLLVNIPKKAEDKKPSSSSTYRNYLRPTLTSQERAKSSQHPSNTPHVIHRKSFAISPDVKSHSVHKTKSLSQVLSQTHPPKLKEHEIQQFGIHNTTSVTPSNKAETELHKKDIVIHELLCRITNMTNEINQLKAQNQKHELDVSQGASKIDMESASIIAELHLQLLHQRTKEQAIRNHHKETLQVLHHKIKGLEKYMNHTEEELQKAKEAAELWEGRCEMLQEHIVKLESSSVPASHDATGEP